MQREHHLKFPKETAQTERRALPLLVTALLTEVLDPKTGSLSCFLLTCTAKISLVGNSLLQQREVAQALTAAQEKRWEHGGGNGRRGWGKLGFRPSETAIESHLKLLKISRLILREMS